MSELNIYNRMDLRYLVEFHLQQGLITVKQSERYPTLRVVKYARRCFYDNLWNDFLKECRGLVIDQDYNVVVYPMTKIFNYGENGWYPKIGLNETVTAYTKYNGFLGCVTNSEKYGIIYSTTGSLDSPFCDMAKDILKETIGEYPPDMNSTSYFEVCHPNDPHIIRENDKWYYLGARRKNVYYPNNDLARRITLRQLFARDDRIEGYVCSTDAGEVFKIKSPFYLRTKFFARANINKLEQVLKNGSTKGENYLQNFDEDLYNIVNIVKQNKDKFLVMSEQGRILFIEQELNKGI